MATKKIKVIAPKADKVTHAGDLEVTLGEIRAERTHNISRQYADEKALKASFEEKSFRELKGGIKADGLLNPLSVTLPSEPGKQYGLEAAFRRYEALKQLAQEKHKDDKNAWKSAKVRVHIVGGSPLKLALMNIKENIQR